MVIVEVVVVVIVEESKCQAQQCLLPTTMQGSGALKEWSKSPGKQNEESSIVEHESSYATVPLKHLHLNPSSSLVISFPE